MPGQRQCPPEGSPKPVEGPTAALVGLGVVRGARYAQKASQPGCGARRLRIGRSLCQTVGKAAGPPTRAPGD